jgi:hypothetical protein
MAVPLWLAWIVDHWFALVLIAGVLWAVVYVGVKRSQLFYKE